MGVDCPRRRRTVRGSGLAALLWAAGCQWPPTTLHADADQPAPPAELAFSDISDQSPDLAAFPTGGDAGWDHSEKYSPGLALVDLDGDGHLDLVQTRNHQSRSDRRSPQIFSGRGDGSFEHALTLPWDDRRNGTFVLAADTDGDGDVDLYLGTDGGPSLLFRNDGQLRFTEIGASAGVDLPGVRAFTATAADVDADGDLDLYVGAWNASAPDHGDGTAPNFLLINDGDGTFSDSTAKAGVDCYGWATLGASFADFDLDGDLDLFVVNDFFDACLYENLGNGSFRDVAEAAGVLHGAWNGMGVAPGDIDGDGDIDLLVTDDEVADASRGNAVYLNRGGSPLGFDSRALELGLDGLSTLAADWLVCWGAGLIDFDLDGDLDVHVTTHALRSELFWQNTTSGFTPVDELIGTMTDIDGRGTAYGDFDSDGDIDLVVAGRGRGLQVVRNDTKGGHWIAVAPQPVGLAPGALVTVETATSTQIAQISAGDSYMSTSPAVATFGLGASSDAATVRIRFADGRVRELADVAADQTITVDY